MVNLFRYTYNSLPTGPIPVMISFENNFHTRCANKNNGTGGSFVLVIWSCRSNETMLMKLAIEKTLMDAEVSFRMLILRCVR
jgi:hypothetical protein